jgi:PAS domain S-box-containing protein
MTRCQSISAAEQHTSTENILKYVVRAKNQWESAIDSLPQLIFLIDLQGKVVRANRSVDSWGLGSVTQVEGKCLHQLLHPACSITNCYLSDLLERISSPSTASRIRERAFDSRLDRNLYVHAFPFSVNHLRKQLNSLVTVVFEDISGRIDAERIIYEREHKLQLLVEFAPDLMVRMTPDGTLMYLSPASMTMLGYTPGQLLGTSIYALIHIHDHAKVRQRAGSIAPHGENFMVICRMRAMDGRYVWVEINGQLMVNGAQAADIVLVVRKMPARKQDEDAVAGFQQRQGEGVKSKTRQIDRAIELLNHKISISECDMAALSNSELRYTMLLRNTIVGIYVLERERLVFCNERFSMIFDVPQQELCGMDVSTLGICQSSEELAQAIGREEMIEVCTRHGTKKWLKLSRAIFEIDGNSFVIGNVVDVSEQVDINERLKVSENELRELSAQLFDTQENERKRIANELHDGIGQRLSAIKFAVEDVLRGESDLGHVRQTERLSDIVRQLRDTIEEVRQVSMDLRPSSLDDLGLLATLDWFCREFGKVYEALHIVKHVDISEADVPDELKVVIFRIIQEAMHNIAKHADANQVAIHLLRDGGGLNLSIQDNGQGFDYVHVAATALGLGLKSMRERAELSHGSFVVNSRASHGTEISVRWPRP